MGRGDGRSEDDELVLKALAAKDKRTGPKKFPDLGIEMTMRVKTKEEGGDGTAPRPPKIQKQVAKEAG